MATLSDMVPAERERLTKAIAGVQQKVATLEAEIAGYEREMRGVDAYEAALSGKTTTRNNSSRASRGSRSQTLLAMIATSDRGMTRAQILEEQGAKGDKAAEGAISNALTTMKKAGKLALKDGTYTAVGP